MSKINSDLSRFQNSEDPILATAGNYAESYADLPPDLQDEQYEFPLEAQQAPLFSDASSVIGAAITYTGATAKRWVHREKQPYTHTGPDTLMASVGTPLPEKITLEEGKALYKEVNVEKTKRTKSYGAYTRQHLPESMRERFHEVKLAVAQLYESENEIKNEYLNTVNDHHFTAAKELNEATLNRDLAISNCILLEKEGIGPLEFQILRKRQDYLKVKKAHEEALASGEESEVSEIRLGYLRARALGQEKNYIVDLIAYRVSELRDSGFNKELWKALENFGAEVIEVYDRLIEGKKLKSTDLVRLDEFRKAFFPYSLKSFNETSWQDAPLNGVQDVLNAENAWKQARQKNANASLSFNINTTPASARLLKKSEEVSQAREALDYQFQCERLLAEWDRLELLLKEKGVSEEEITQNKTYFMTGFEGYKKAYKESCEYYKNFIAGEDVTARENIRNKLSKKVLIQLAFGAQWALNEIYSNYDLRDEYGDKALPSCVSFTYVNTMRLMAEVFKRGKPSDVEAEDYVASVFRMFFKAYDELGFKFKFINIGGRKFLDITKIDLRAAQVGLENQLEKPDSYVLQGWGPYSYLLAQQVPHPDVLMMEGANHVYPQGIRFGEGGIEDVSQEAYVMRMNHVSSRDFWFPLSVPVWGMHAPQLAQDGMSNVPIMSGYLQQRTFYVAREEGSAEANAQMVNKLSAARTVAGYFSGTRNGETPGSHFFADYAEDPDLVLEWSNTTDRRISGQDVKIAMIMKDLSGSILLDPEVVEENGIPKTHVPDTDILLTNMISNTGTLAPESSWNLGKGSVGLLAENLAAKTTMSFSDPDNRPVQLGLGLMLSSEGYLTPEEWEKIYPDFFVHVDKNNKEIKIPFSDREKYTQALYLNTLVMTADQRLTAAKMDLVRIPEPNEKQKTKAQALKSKSFEERRQEMEEGMATHMRKRMERLRTAAEKNNLELSPRAEAFQEILLDKNLSLPERSSRKLPLYPLSRMDKITLESKVRKLTSKTTKEIETYLTDLKYFEFHKDPAKAKEGLTALVEAYRHGILVGEKNKSNPQALAFDLDKVIWDHFFVGDVVNAKKLAQQIHDSRLSGKNEGDAYLREKININPLWMAFLIGYKEKAGATPLFFTASTIVRLRAMADDSLIKQNPSVRFFMEYLFGKGTTAEQIHQILDDKENTVPVISREKALPAMRALLKKWADQNYSYEGLSDVEKTDIISILKSYKEGWKGLKTSADVHLKLRSLAPYQTLVDDRRQNAEAAHQHEGVTVFNPQPFDHPLGRLYVAADTTSDISARLNEGRTGVPLDIMRQMNFNPNAEGKLTYYPEGVKVEKVSGLYDSPVEIQYPYTEVEREYLQPERETVLIVETVFKGLKEKALAQEKEIKRHRYALIKLLGDDSIYKKGELAPVRIKNALNFLNPEGKDGKVHKISPDLESYNATQFCIRFIEDPIKKAEAENLLAQIIDRTLVDTYREFRPEKKPRKASGDPLAPLKKIWGKISKQLPGVGAFARGRTVSFQNWVTDKLESIVKQESIFQKLFNIKRYYRLHRLGLHMKNEIQLSLSDQVRAYGIVANKLLVPIGNNLLDGLVTFVENLENNDAIEDKEGLTTLRENLREWVPDYKQRLAEVAELIEKLCSVAANTIKEVGKLGREFQSLNPLDYIPLRNGIVEYLRSGVLSPYFKDSAQQINWEALDQEMGAINKTSQLFYTALWIARQFVPKENMIHFLLTEALNHIRAHGFENTLMAASNFFDAVKGINKVGESSQLAQMVEEGQWSDVRDYLMNWRSLEKIKNPRDLEKRYKSLATATWLMVDDKDKGQQLMSIYAQTKKGTMQRFYTTGDLNRAFKKSNLTSLKTTAHQKRLKVAGNGFFKAGGNGIGKMA